ncbi:iron-sulfur cluster assembly scaffold protein [Desulfuromonas acetexigens]|jgi:nitrogen fixation NifU-like protein|uniref:Iron-sulfur cluster assembly scaffold protein n=1 Tax=Trichloromonas acetexigens TaxID=38815 RepID=A0A550JC40_9BACT|nr:iron-sulfur cluster assembly scaffold protein [Desulfuromonas acetexigens]TRO80662.1 iron-sulfur cluster assembly scaffold protein [Desulfuromonas acetexigens]
MYTAKVMDHFANPRNVGIIEDANVVVQVGDPGCGDGLLIFLKIEDDRISDMKYKIYGCGAAIATSSMASEMAIGKSLDEVLVEVTEENIAAALDGLPDEKMHCSNLAASALRAAIAQYKDIQRKKAAAAG